MLSSWKACCGPLPQRWVFAFMGFLAIMNAYAMRNCLSLAITEMAVSEPSTESEEIDETLCPAENTTTTTSSSGGTFDWSESLQGVILSSFYWGYIITHVPGGMLAERFGGKWILGVGILTTGIFTLVTPVVVEWADSTGLIVLRFLMGVGEGTTFPALNVMLAHWVPRSSRAMMGSVVYAGAQIGIVFASAVSGLLLQYSSMGWPSVFYFFGALGVGWFLVFAVVCYSSPEEHPFISDKERNFIVNAVKMNTEKRIPPPPWRHILRSVPLWALVGAQIGHDWGLFTMVSDLPSYMSGALHFSIKSNGFLSALPYLTMWICSLATSSVADWLINSGAMSITNARKLFTTLGSMGPAIFLLAASYAGCNRVVVVILFTIGMGFMGTYYAGMKVNSLDLSPNYAGTLMAIVNGIGAISGVITPYLTGVLAPNETVGEYRLVFWIVFGVFAVTNLFYVFCASGEVQYWNDPDFLVKEQQKQENRATGEATESPRKDTT